MLIIVLGVSVLANVSNVNSYSSKDNLSTTKKISFDIGEVFTAQVLGADTESGEVVLRTSDGWKFDAKVENFNQMDSFSGNGKFVVDGVKDGKVIIKLLDMQEKKPDDKQIINEELLKDLGLTNSKENIDLLKTLIEHNMPLTQENISKMKTIIDFKRDLNDDSNKANEFISKFLENKNIDIKSEEGQTIYSKLKDFFQELKNLTSEDILTFFENKLELNENNIKSFNKLFKGEGSLYKELENIDKSVNNNLKRTDNLKNYPNDSSVKNTNSIKNEEMAENISEAIKNHNKNVETNSEKLEDNIKPNSNIDKGENSKKINSEEIIKLINNSNENISADKKTNLINNIKTLDSLRKIVENSGNKNETIFNSGNDVVAEKIKNYILENAKDLQNISGKDVIRQVMSNIEGNLKLSDENANDILKALQSLDGKEGSKSIIEKNIVESSANNVKLEETAKLIKNLVNTNNIDKVQANSAQNVKEQINLKIENMKDFISNLIDANKGDNSSLSQKVYEIIKNNINDFKVFNNISNEYYYMDIPVTNNQNDYKCKLIIKDDRKSGKKVDSKNVKLVTSVKTVNMGVVDAYVRVFDNNMNVNLKCEKQWVKIFNRTKDTIIGKISNMGYNINMSVDKKEDKEEVDIVSCRSFFNDNSSYSKIDVRV